MRLFGDTGGVVVSFDSHDFQSFSDFDLNSMFFPGSELLVVLVDLWSGWTEEWRRRLLIRVCHSA